MDRSSLFTKKGATLEYITAGWIVVEALVTVVAGIIAGSIALVGFGLNRMIETVSVGMRLWHLHSEQSQQRDVECSGTKRRGFFIAGVGFVLLALYMINESGFTLFNREKPEVSIVGIVFSILSLIFIFSLIFIKMRISIALESKAGRADALKIVGRAYLPLVLAVGLGCHAWLGWWWADAVAALLMVPIIVREGWDAIEMSKGNSPSQVVKTDS